MQNPKKSKPYAKLDRRSLLKHAALATFIAPAVRQTMARAQGAPKRLMCVFWPNGLNHVSAGPSGSETTWSLGEYFTNLEKHKADTLAFAGLQVGGVPYGANTEYGHQSGGKGCLTCTPDEKTGKATGPSIDQLVSQKLFEQKLAPMRKAFIFGVGASKLPGYGPVFHEAAGKLAPIEADPKLAYQSVFSNVMVTGGQDINKLIARRKSILDVALADCKAQLPALPANGKLLVDYHCTRIRELEDSLAGTAGSIKTCAEPKAALDAIAALNAKDPNNYPALTDFFWKLTQTVFLCDISRVASFTWGNTASRFNMPWVMPPTLASVDTGEKNVKDHHSHTHAGTRQTIGLFMAWYAQKMSALLDLLKEKGPDGQRLLDSMIVHLTTEYGGGGPHYNGNFSCFIFGSAGGQLKQGRLLQYKNDTKMHHAMMVSIIKAMGIKGVEQFGHPMGGMGPNAAMFV
jgi:hypothetical protein